MTAIKEGDTKHWTGKINLALATVVTLFGFAGAPSARAQQNEPNILVIFGDDVGSGMSVPTTEA